MQQRVKEYATKPEETLNDDQKRSLQGLHALELSARELEDVRKAIEVSISAPLSTLSELTRYLRYTKENRLPQRPVVSPGSRPSLNSVLRKP